MRPVSGSNPTNPTSTSSSGEAQSTNISNLVIILNTSTKQKTKQLTEVEQMQVLEQNKELTKEELYFLTKAQDVQKMAEAVDSIFDLTAWCIYLDHNSDGEEVELFSMRTTDGETFATNSPTFIRAFREILDIFSPDEVKRLKVMNGVSKNNRTFVTCAYVSPVE